jgi:hypothetical protein
MRLAPFAVASLVLVVSFPADVLADEAPSPPPPPGAMERRTLVLEPVRSAAPDPCLRAYLPEATCPCPCGPEGFTAFAEFLYWKSDQSRTLLTESLMPPVDEVDAESIDFDFGPGFRVGGGYRFCGGWDVTVAWTHWESDTDDDFALDPPPNAVGIGFETGLDWLTIDAGRSFMITPCFAGRVFAGLQYAHLTEEFRQSQTAGLTQVEITDDREFNGIGLRMGGDFHYCFGCGFSAYGTGSFGFLVGDFEEELRQVAVTDGQLQSDFTFNSESADQLVPVFNLRMGVAWCGRLGCMCLRAALGYEFLNFQDLNWSVADDDLNFHGPTLRLEVLF